MTATRHLLGRCTAKGCKTAARVTADTTTIAGGRDYWGQPVREPAITTVRLRGEGDPYNPTWTVDSTVVATSRVERLISDYLPRCVAHRRPLRWSRVNGRRNDDVKCSASCQNARRADCECSCEGANHGSGHG